MVAAMLASPANGFITGANYRVDGGQTRGLN
jgi:NAD(P)-dependent dehydrogenase (short-subunit alcohol dehydrogenase family)